MTLINPRTARRNGKATLSCRAFLSPGILELEIAFFGAFAASRDLIRDLTKKYSIKVYIRVAGGLTDATQDTGDHSVADHPILLRRQSYHIHRESGNSHISYALTIEAFEQPEKRLAFFLSEGRWYRAFTLKKAIW
jgi:hypothetical protein